MKFNTVSVRFFVLLSIFLGGCCLGLNLQAQTRTIAKGPWEFCFDTSNGYWKHLKWNGTIICRNDGNIVPFNWGPDWPGGKIRTSSLLNSSAIWFPKTVRKPKNCRYELKKINWDDKKSTLLFDYEIGDWKVKETITLGTENAPDLLSRKLDIIYSPVQATDQPVMLRDVVINMPFIRQGRFFFPQEVKWSNPDKDRVTVMSKLPQAYSQEAFRSSQACLPLLIEPTDDKTAILIPDSLNDRSSMQIVMDKNDVCARANFKSYGWAYPNESQTIGPVFMKMTGKKLESAFQGGVWKLYDEVGLMVPTDRPEWLRDTVLYCFHPGGSFSSRLHDLGGYKAAEEEVIPRAKLIGYNTLWVMPVGKGWHPFLPQNPKEIEARYGTAEEYSSMMKTAHDRGMRVIQGIVPHGGYPRFAIDRGNKPWDLLFDKDGNPHHHWSFDYQSPGWNNYMAGVAKYYLSEYNVDGFRIDLADGNIMPNMRKKDFPSIKKIPKYVPKDWWESELEKNGGMLPPLPYSRASFCRRRGGMAMIEAVRKSCQEIKPRESIVLGEVISAVPYMCAADLVYDKEYWCLLLRGEWFRLNMKNVMRTDFARTISNWYEEQKYAEPENTCRMRLTGCHDSVPIAPYLGVGATQAATAVTFFIDGVPMVYQNTDIGYGMFLKKVINLRNKLPELRRGNASYLAADVSSKQVFACVRNYKSNLSVALINFSAAPATLQVKIPENMVGDGKWNAWDCWEEKLLAAGNTKTVCNFTVKLPPWGINVVALRPDGERCPVAFDKSDKAAVPEKNLSVKSMDIGRNSWGHPQVKTPVYTIVVNKDTGLLHQLNDSAGNALIDGMKLINDTFSGIKTNAVTFMGKCDIIKTGYGCRIDSVINPAVGGTVKFSFRCFPDHVELDAGCIGPVKSNYFGLLLSAPDIFRWQANTAEGLLDDFFFTSKYRTMDRGLGANYRYQGTPILWQSEQIPLSLESAMVTALQKSGNGVALEVKNPLTPGLDNVMVMNEFAGKYGWQAAFLWKSDSLYDNENNNTRDFTISMKPIERALGAPKQSCSFKVGEVSVRNTSVKWEVKTPFYSLNIPRVGGYLENISNREGKRVISDVSLFSDNGYHSQINDNEASIKLWQENNKLHMRFIGMLKNSSLTASNSRMLSKPPVYFYTHYIFDGASSKIIVRAGLCFAGTPSEKILPAGVGIETALRNIKLEVSPNNSDVIATDSKGKELFAVNNIIDPSGFYQHINSDKNKINFACKKLKNVSPGQWQEISYSLNLK